MLVLTGAGRGFCAGLDLADAATLPEMTAAGFLEGQEAWSRAITSFRRLPKPVTAAVNGRRRVLVSGARQLPARALN